MTAEIYLPMPSIHNTDLVDANGLRVEFNLPSIRTVNELRKRRAIPCIRLGYRTYRYSIAAVAAALARLEIKEVGRPK